MHNETTDTTTPTTDLSTILAELSKPFHPSHITWKPGALNRDKNKALALAYADLRAYQDRLDEVLGLGWAVNYTPWGDRIVCHLTIAGVTRSSTGEPDSQSEKSEIAGTAAEAQAFKRACAMFSLGRYLYNLPSVWAEYDNEKKGWTDAAKAHLNSIIVQHFRRHLDADAELGELARRGKGKGADKGKPEANATPDPSPAKAPTPATAGDVDFGMGGREAEAITPQAEESGHLQGEIDTLGASLYGDQWPQVRSHNCERITGGVSAALFQLDNEQLKRMLGGLKKLKRQRSAA